MTAKTITQRVEDLNANILVEEITDNDALITGYAPESRREPDVRVFLMTATRNNDELRFALWQSARNADTPEPVDFFDMLRDLSLGIENSEPLVGRHPEEWFTNWCDELGRDTDSRSAYRTWGIHRELSTTFRRWLGGSAQYRAWLYQTEGL